MRQKEQMGQKGTKGAIGHTRGRTDAEKKLGFHPVSGQSDIPTGRSRRDDPVRLSDLSDNLPGRDNGQ